MHVPDGFFNAATAVGAGMVSAGAIAASLRRAASELSDRLVPLAGLVGAFVFALQMLNFPVASGTSGHLIGGALAAVLVGPWIGCLCLAVVLLVQALLFAVAAGLGVQHTPHAWVFRTRIRPRLGPPAALEDPAPPRFAQAVGLGFALVGVVAFLAGATLLGVVATGFALVAALLNAVFGLCLGCEMYLLIRRFAG